MKGIPLPFKRRTPPPTVKAPSASASPGAVPPQKRSAAPSVESKPSAEVPAYPPQDSVVMRELLAEEKINRDAIAESRLNELVLIIHFQTASFLKEISRLRESNLYAQDAITKRDIELTLLREDCVDSETIKTWQEEKDELATALATAQAKCTEVSKQVLAHEQEIIALRVETRGQKEELSELRRAHLQQSSALIHAHEEISAANARTAEKEKRIVDLEGSVRKLTELNARVCTAHSSLGTSLDKRGLALEECSRKLAEREAACIEHRREYENAMQQISEMQREMVRLEEALRTASGTISAQQAEMKKLAAQLEAARQESASVEERVQTARSHEIKAIQEVSSLRSELSTAREESARRSEITDMHEFASQFASAALKPLRDAFYNFTAQAPALENESLADALERVNDVLLAKDYELRRALQSKKRLAVSLRDAETAIEALRTEFIRRKVEWRDSLASAIQSSSRVIGLETIVHDVFDAKRVTFENTVLQNQLARTKEELEKKTQRVDVLERHLEELAGRLEAQNFSVLSGPKGTREAHSLLVDQALGIAPAERQDAPQERDDKHSASRSHIGVGFSPSLQLAVGITSNAAALPGGKESLSGPEKHDAFGHPTHSQTKISDLRTRVSEVEATRRHLQDLEESSADGYNQPYRESVIRNMKSFLESASAPRAPTADGETSYFHVLPTEETMLSRRTEASESPSAIIVPASSTSILTDALQQMKLLASGRSKSRQK